MTANALPILDGEILDDDDQAPDLCRGCGGSGEVGLDDGDDSMPCPQCGGHGLDLSNA
jgi:DnaJ-class molecular chaperone